MKARSTSGCGAMRLRLMTPFFKPTKRRIPSERFFEKRRTRCGTFFELERNVSIEVVEKAEARSVDKGDEEKAGRLILQHRESKKRNGK